MRLGVSLGSSALKRVSPGNVWKSMNRSIAWVGSDQKGIQKLKRGILHNRCKTTDVINQLRLIEVSYNMETETRLKM